MMRGCSRALFRALGEFSRGDVLDVGGWDLFLAARSRRVPYRRWVTIDSSQERCPAILDPAFHWLVGDGCRLPFSDSSFDGVLNV